MTPAQRKMLLAGLVPLLVLVVAAGAVTVSLIRGKLPYSYSSVVTPGPQGVRVVSEVPTQLLGSVDGKVHVTVDGSYAEAQPKVQISTVDGVLNVATSCPDIHCSVDLTVEVPATSTVQATANQGSIAVNGVASPLTVDALNGSIDMAGLRSPRVSADAQRGSISLLFRDAPEQVTATARNGSLTVQLPRTTTYAIDAVAALGSTEVDIPNNPSSANRVYLRANDGSITVQ
jgi:hypothetical protein